MNPPSQLPTQANWTLTNPIQLHASPSLLVPPAASSGTGSARRRAGPERRLELQRALPNASTSSSSASSSSASGGGGASRLTGASGGGGAGLASAVGGGRTGSVGVCLPFPPAGGGEGGVGGARPLPLAGAARPNSSAGGDRLGVASSAGGARLGDTASSSGGDWRLASSRRSSQASSADSGEAQSSWLWIKPASIAPMIGASIMTACTSSLRAGRLALRPQGPGGRRGRHVRVALRQRAPPGPPC